MILEMRVGDGGTRESLVAVVDFSSCDTKATLLRGWNVYMVRYSSFSSLIKTELFVELGMRQPKFYGG